MTTVIVDRKRGAVYSDSRGTNTEVSGTFRKREEYTYCKVNKISRVHGHVIAGCGSLNVLNKVVERFHKEKRLPDTFYFKDKYDLGETYVLVTKETLGKCYTVEYNLTVTNLLLGWKRVKVSKTFIGEDKKYSVKGSGMLLAIGALEQGATTEEAIKIASKHDMYTDNDVKAVWV